MDAGYAPVMLRRFGKHARRWSWRARIAVAAALLVLLLLGAEVFCRFYLGLGDPPLSQADPQIEYLFKPNQTCRRFGNLIHYNAHSMRSDDFPAAKTDPRELRVMVFGDSVINGGVQTNQNELATALVQQTLSAKLKRKVVVGNISAGSWGPPNMLAYARHYGTFNADAVVIVLSSHDYADAPTFRPIVGVDPNFPGERPWCALGEAITRYLPRYLGRGAGGDPVRQAEPEPQNVRECLAATVELISLARAGGASVAVALHRSRQELGQSDVPGLRELRQAAEKAGVQVIDLDEQLTAGEAASLYRDDIHPNAQGQRRIAEQLIKLLHGLLTTGEG